MSFNQINNTNLINNNINQNNLKEYSVVYTSSSLNHMSNSFQFIMKEISNKLKFVYSADSCLLVPGGGSFAMEAVARQFATNKNCLVIRNGMFSYRWTQIFEMGNIPKEHYVIKARKLTQDSFEPFHPPPIVEVLHEINTKKPHLVFAPHVETSSGIILPLDYIQQISRCVHEYGGLFVLDCIASGCIWIDMREAGVDVLITAPQKGWSSSPGFGMVMLSSNALIQLNETTSSSFVCDLKKWYQIMKTYEEGGHAYHATMPTDSIAKLFQSINEIEQIGFAEMSRRQQELGDKVRQLLVLKGYPSVSAEGYQSPGVVVSYTRNPSIKSGLSFLEKGVQISAGVPLFCDEGSDFLTFRIGLFGIDKLTSIDETVANLGEVLDLI